MGVNEDGLISAGLVKLIIVLVVVGVVAIDAGSILVNTFTLDSTANEIARDVSAPFGNAGVVELNPLEVKEQAKSLAHEAGAKLLKAQVDSENTVYIRLRRTANTFVVGRIGPIEDWARATAEAQVANNP
jgi:hypothetical protein